MTASTVPASVEVTAEIDSLIRCLSLLVGVYAESDPALVSSEETAAYTAGFRNGARSAYSDCVGRLQELKQAVQP